MFTFTYPVQEIMELIFLKAQSEVEAILVYNLLLEFRLGC